MKNLNAIVWLYRGEIDKYQKLLGEYRTALCSDNFDEVLSQLTAKTEQVKAESKSALETCAKRDKKATQAKYDEMLSALAEQTETAKQAKWLKDKFGDGEYKDVLGLCKLANREEIKEKGCNQYRWLSVSDSLSWTGGRGRVYGQRAVDARFYRGGGVWD